MTSVAMISSQGSVPVQKKSKDTVAATPADAAGPLKDGDSHSKNPKIRKPMAPPTFNQSDVLNLLRSTSASM